MTHLPIAILSINFCCFLFEPLLISNRNLKARFLKMPVFFQKLFVFIYAGPLFIAPVVPQSRFYISNALSLPMGTLLFVLGWIFIISAFFRIGATPGVRKKSDLITSGISGVIRHPISSGTLFSVLGWAIPFKSMISMILPAFPGSSPITEHFKEAHPRSGIIFISIVHFPDMACPPGIHKLQEHCPY